MSEDIFVSDEDVVKSTSSSSLTKRGSRIKDSPTYTLAHIIMKNRRFYTDGGAELWIFDETKGLWTPKARPFIRKQAVAMLAEKWTKHKENEIIGFIHSSRFDPDVELGKLRHRIVLLNGTYDLDEMVFHNEFFPEEYQTIQIPVDYDPKAKCPKFKKFMKEIIPDEWDRLCIMEWFGYHLYKSYKFAIFLICLGDGANGKSTMLAVLERFIGKENSSSCTLKQILQDKFKTAQLYMKLGNVCGDVSKTGLAKTGTIKQLTGGDKLTAEHKHLPEFSFYNFGKLTFAANELPYSYDKTSAFHRRVRIIEFLRVFLADDPNTRDQDELIDEMTTPKELSGIFNAALEGWERLRSKRQLTGTKPIEDNTLYWTLKSDPAAYFCMQYLVHDTKYPDIKKAWLYDVYIKWSHTIDKTPISSSWLSRKLKIMVPFAEDASSSGGARYWKGFRVDEEKMRADLRELEESGTITIETTYFDLLFSFIEGKKENNISENGVLGVSKKLDKVFDDEGVES